MEKSTSKASSNTNLLTAKNVAAFPLIIYILILVIFLISFYCHYRYNKYRQFGMLPPREFRTGNYIFYIMLTIIVILFFGTCFFNPSVCHLISSHA